MCDEGESPWATLTPLYGEDRNPIQICSDLFSIGRHADCDLSLQLPAVSACHCTIMRDPQGKVVLQDTSKNGTVINGETKVKEELHDLTSGSEVYLVFRRNCPSENIVFLFELASVSALERTQELEEEQDDPPAISKAVKRPGSPSVEETSGPSCAKSCRSDEAGPSKLEEEDRGMLDTLICAICQEILHDCVSVQPCLHSFCAGCFSDYMQPSCPSCRQKATRVARNHLVNNIVEEFLKRNPDRRRPQEDLDELDSKNKINNELVFSGLERSDSFASDSSSPPGFVLPVHVPRPVCRQCPNFPPVLFGNSTPPPFSFTCDPYSTVHILCQCCLRPMPKRTDLDILAKQQCAVCFAFFCGIYFGCANTCVGCLRQVKDTSLSGLCDDAILNSNPYESRVLLDYLRERSISLQTLMWECAENLQSHRLYTPSTAANVTGDSFVCRSCGQRLLREYSYHYRAAIPADQLPEDVRNRPNCYWGRRCRTQIRMNHAQRYNHICEQTRQA